MASTLGKGHVRHIIGGCKAQQNLDGKQTVAPVALAA